MKANDLIASARILTNHARSTPGRPLQAQTRRAVSTAYYAVFHELCSQSADAFIGGAGADRSEPAWRQVYRGINHRDAAERGKKVRNPELGFPAEIIEYVNAFVDLQDKRHKADYAPDYRVSVADAEALIVRAENAIARLRGCAAKDRSAFCAWVIFGRR